MAIIDMSVPRAFGDILGGLLGSVIEAQAQASRSTIDFIEEVGTLEGPVNSDVTHELRNVKFNYIKNDEEGKAAKYTLELPLLSMVEIPAISIKTAKFSFYYDVTDTTVTDMQEKAGDVEKSADGSGVKLNSLKKKLAIKKPLHLKGRVNKVTNSKSTTEQNGGIKVDVEFEKSPMTIGMNRILDMLELAATETPVDAPPGG